MPDNAEPDAPAEVVLRARARERLARELHDELTHRVAAVSLQVMGHRGTSDLAALRGSMETIAAATSEILAGLTMLDRVLRAHPFDTAPPPPGTGRDLLAHLSVCEPVSVVVEHLATALGLVGYAVAASVSPGADDVGAVARRSLQEGIVAAREVIERHAVPTGRCSIEVSVSPGTVALLVSAPVTGWGEEDEAALVTLRERARLTEGTLRNDVREAADGPVWSLDLRLRDR